MIAKSTFHKKPPILWDWKAKMKWQRAAKRINHASMSTIPTEEAKGIVMARMPQRSMRIAQSIDQPLAFLTEPRVNSGSILVEEVRRFGKNYGVGEDSVVDDSVVVESVLVVSDDGVGLAGGVTVSVLFSQAKSVPAAKSTQIYLIMSRFYPRTHLAVNNYFELTS